MACETCRIDELIVAVAGLTEVVGDLALEVKKLSAEVQLNRNAWQRTNARTAALEAASATPAPFRIDEGHDV